MGETVKEKKPILLIDQDDVLAEYILGVTEAFNKKHNTKFTTSDCISWDLFSVFGENIAEIMHEPELFRHLAPADNAVEVFQRLYESKLFEMYIVTAANPKAVKAKYEWIQQYLPFFPQERVIICMHKFMIKGDYLLDDGMHNIEAFSEAGGVPIVFERPHNGHLPHRYLKIKNWLEFEAFILDRCYGDKTKECSSDRAEAIHKYYENIK